MLTESIGDDERRRDATYIWASLRVVAAAGRLHRRSFSTYLFVIRHRRRFLHTARRRSQRRSRGLLLTFALIKNHIIG